MSGGEHEKSVLKLVAIFLAFGLGYTSVLHSVAAVYELSTMDVIISYYADYAICRPEERSTVNTTANIAGGPLHRTIQWMILPAVNLYCAV